MEARSLIRRGLIVVFLASVAFGLFMGIRILVNPTTKESQPELTKHQPAILLFDTRGFDPSQQELIETIAWDLCRKWDVKVIIWLGNLSADVEGEGIEVFLIGMDVARGLDAAAELFKGHIFAEEDKKFLLFVPSVLPQEEDLPALKNLAKRKSLKGVTVVLVDPFKKRGIKGNNLKRKDSQRVFENKTAQGIPLAVFIILQIIPDCFDHPLIEAVREVRYSLSEGRSDGRNRKVFPAFFTSVVLRLRSGTNLHLFRKTFNS